MAMDKQLLQHLEQSEIKPMREARELKDHMNGMGAKIKRIEAGLASKSSGLTVEALKPFIVELAHNIEDIRLRIKALKSQPLRYVGIWDST